MDKQLRKIIVNSVSVLKTGKSQKNGKSWTWTLSKVEAVVLPSEKQMSFTTFDDFAGREEQEVEVEIEEVIKEKDGKTYKNYQISLPKKNVWDTIHEIEARLDNLEEEMFKLTVPGTPMKKAEEPKEQLPF